MENILGIVNANKKDLIANFNVVETDFKNFEQIIKNIQWNKLYDSKMHGEYHSKKVLLFSYLIAKANNFNEEDLKIICDAAIYHDMGRINDYEDSIYGYASAIRVEQVINDEIYNNNENLNLLKAIIDGHSVTDERRDSFYDYYDLLDKERFIKLYNVLKDADALDRCRFYEAENMYLDESFLRMDISKKLIPFSKKINEIYKKKIVKSNLKSKKEAIYTTETHGCFHSVGFDFFKIKSVLQKGILSKANAKKEGLVGVSNFLGGNLDNYVSVVDASLISNKGSAFNTFIQNGVSFICEVDKLYKADSNWTKSYCIEQGLPYNQSFHEDELYVLDKINPENIISIYLSKDIKNKDIRDLNYIYNSLSFKHFYERVNYYYKNVSKNININLDAVKKLLIYYKKVIDKYIRLDGSERIQQRKKITIQLEKIRVEINKIIQFWIYSNYAFELNVTDDSKITVDDVVQHELNKLMNKELPKNESKTIIYLNENFIDKEGLNAKNKI